MFSRKRYGGDEGMALVLAVLVLAVVTIAATSAILYATSSQKDAYSKKARQNAYSLAQAALSNATAQLTSHYYNSSGSATNSATPGAASWVPTTTQVSPSSTATCTIGSSTTTCMQWSASINTTGPFTGVQKASWTITGKGSVPNPSAPGALTKSLSEVIPVTQPPMYVPPPDIWKGIYSGAPASSGCDLTTGQGVVWVSPVVVKGNLCIQQQSGVGSPGTLNVGGWLQNVQGGYAGTSSAPLPSVKVAGACNGSASSTPACAPAWDSVHNYYADTSQNIYATSISNAPTFPNPPPTVDWTTRATESGIGSSPAGWSCTNGKSVTSATFDLTAGAPYSCTTPSGSLSWDGTTLSISGNVYVTGNLITQNNANVVYTGIGGLYVGGTATFGNNTAICVGSTASHTCPQGYSWDTAQSMLLILVKGGITGANLALEGGLYSDNDINFSSGQTQINGPIVTLAHLIPGQQASSGFPSITAVPSGSPEAPSANYLLGTPTTSSF